MLRIRLSRIGKKNKAQFRITVADARKSPTGKFIEILGYYNPHTKEKVFKDERIKYWILKGAKPSPTVHNFLIDAKIIEGAKVTSWKPKKKEKVDENKDETKKEVKVEEKEKKEDVKTEEKKETKSEESVKKEVKK